MRDFNPRTHMGCDLDARVTDCEGAIFQSTHPHGVRLRGPGPTMSKLSFQSTHPHGVRRRRTIYRIIWQHFNPRTHMGCDFRQLIHTRLAQYFNPRTHMGCDESEVMQCPKKQSISIHAPTWGATAINEAAFAGAYISIHAPTWGATS